MKKLPANIRLALCLILFLLTLPTYATAAISQAGNDHKQRVIVIFDRQIDKQVITEAEGTVNRVYTKIPACAISVPPSALQGLRNSPRVKAVEPDGIVTIADQTPDWGIMATKAQDAWTSGFTGAGIKVAVLDTGIANHPDLVISGGISFAGDSLSYTDANGHGTHVAGIIGAQNNDIGTVGIAPEASLYAVRVVDANGTGYMSDVIAGIEWAIYNDMDIISISLGSSEASEALQQETDAAYAQGLLVVAAAGNSGTGAGDGNTIIYPARYDSAIAVAATDSENNRASWSATGSEIEVAAPGVNIRSTYLNGGYTTMSGTSMATPYVAGELALLKQANPNLSNTELRQKLDENVLDLGAAGRDSWYGYGLIQASVDAYTVESFVTRFYELCLLREPDTAGLHYWVEKLASGQMTGARLAQDFVFSPEFQTRNISDSDYLDIMYRTCFAREPDSGGQSYWQDQMNQGMSRAFVLAGFVNSSEFSSLCVRYGIEPGSISLDSADTHPQITAFVARFYQLCLSREPDVAGLNFWVEQLVAGNAAGATVAQNFFFSPEFLALQVGDARFVEILYLALLDREPDSAGSIYWTNSLDNKRSRQDVLAGLVYSPEFADVCSDYGIEVGTLDR